MSERRTFRVPRRAVSLITAGGFAAAGVFALATAGPAAATAGDPHKVWVCKYVTKPHGDELLKGGKNPIFVDWASLTGKDTEPHVGDTFSDAHDKSIVIQIGGEDPGIEACPAGTTPTTTVPPTTTVTTTVPPTTTVTTTPPTTTVTTTAPPTTVPPTTPGGGGGGGETPGTGAPDTGGAGSDNPVNGLVGSALLLSAAGILGAETLRRRRETTNA